MDSTDTIPIPVSQNALVEVRLRASFENIQMCIDQGYLIVLDTGQLALTMKGIDR